MPKYKQIIHISDHARERFAQRLGIYDFNRQIELSHSVLHDNPIEPNMEMRKYKTFHYRRGCKSTFVFSKDSVSGEYTLVTIIKKPR